MGGEGGRWLHRSPHRGDTSLLLGSPERGPVEAAESHSDAAVGKGVFGRRRCSCVRAIPCTPFGCVFPSPPRRGSIVVQIKFAATFSESVVPSKSGVLGVGTKQEKNPGHRAGRPGAPPQEARSHAWPPLLTCLYIACVPLCSETATPCVAEHNVWTIFKNSSVISQGVRTPRSSQPRGWARRGSPDDVG